MYWPFDPNGKARWRAPRIANGLGKINEGTNNIAAVNITEVELALSSMPIPCQVQYFIIALTNLRNRIRDGRGSGEHNPQLQVAFLIPFILLSCQALSEPLAPACCDDSTFRPGSVPLYLFTRNLHSGMSQRLVGQCISITLLSQLLIYQQKQYAKFSPERAELTKSITDLKKSLPVHIPLPISKGVSEPAIKTFLARITRLTLHCLPTRLRVLPQLNSVIHPPTRM